MANQQILISGYDPTGLPTTPTNAQLLQMVQAAVFKTGGGVSVGGVIWQNSAPIVADDPRLAFFLWIETADPDPQEWVLNYYDSVLDGWFPLIKYDGAAFIDGSIPLTKLSVVGTSPFDLMVVNGVGDSWTNMSIATLLANVTFPITSITPGTVGQLLQTLAGPVVGWGPLPAGAISGVPIAITQLAGGANGQIIRIVAGVKTWYTFVANEMIPDFTLDPVKITPGDEGDILQTSGGFTLWGPNPGAVQPTNIYAVNAVYGATMDIAFTKPSDKTWRRIKLQAMSCFKSGSAPRTVEAQFTWRTAPETGNALAVSSSVGAGNGTQQFTLENSDDTISPVWYYEGEIDPDLLTTDTITVRISYTLGGGTTAVSAYFTGIADYV